MGRPVFPHELTDNDFSWLVNSFRENNPNSFIVESACLPIVLFREGVNLHDEFGELRALPPGEYTGAEDERGDIESVE